MASTGSEPSGPTSSDAGEDNEAGTRCPRCERDGQPHEIAVTLTRWSATAPELTSRCAHCGWENTRIA
jgi:ribosomal protein L37E